MAMILVDTSAWIRHFARNDPFELASVCPVEERLLCLPVYQEILQGIRDEGAFREIREALESATMLDDPLPQRRFLEAAELYRSARRMGITVRSSVDCLIAACAIHHNVPVLHSDRDFAQLSRISALLSHEV